MIDTVQFSGYRELVHEARSQTQLSYMGKQCLITTAQSWLADSFNIPAKYIVTIFIMLPWAMRKSESMLG